MSFYNIWADFLFFFDMLGIVLRKPCIKQFIQKVFQREINFDLVT